jgi:hypothetical protein
MKDLSNVKEKQAAEEGIKDFFKQRDSGNKVADTDNILSKEMNTKEELYKKSLEIETLPPHIKPLFSNVFLTARRNKLTENGLYLPTASFGSNGDTDLEVDFSDTQIVLSTGGAVKEIQAGWEVVINVDNFKRRLSDTLAQKLNKDYVYELPVKEIEGVEYIYLSERDISYVSNTNEILIEPL